jgi:hypothetical protein
MNLEDATTKKALHDAVQCISEEMDKMDDAREQIKDIVISLSKATEIPKPMIRKVARLYHKRSAATYEAEASEIKTLYKAISS